MSTDRSPLIDDSHPTIQYNTTNSTLETTETEIQNNETQPKTAPQYIAAITATLSALCAGTVLGWTSPIQSDLEAGRFHNLTISTAQMGWIGSFVTLGGMSMCVPTGFVCDLIGRRTALLALTPLFLAGWALILLSTSVPHLYLGRFLTGMASGGACVAGPLYAAEVGEPRRRGALGAYFQLMVTVGILAAYVLGSLLAPQSFTAVCACLPLLFFCLFLAQPETPTYWLRRGRRDRALRSLARLRGGADAAHAPALAALALELGGARAPLRALLRRRPVWRALVIAHALMLFQQGSGVNAVILYTSDIFAGARVDARAASVAVGVCQVAATLAASLLVDRWGRRPLLLASELAMAAAMAALGGCFSLGAAGAGVGPVVCVCAFIVMFSVGLGPIPWLMGGEIFAPEVRGVAGGAASTFNWLLAFVITKFYLEVSEAVGLDLTYYGFAGMSLAGAAFVYWGVPETKGRSVEEVQRILEG